MGARVNFLQTHVAAICRGMQSECAAIPEATALTCRGIGLGPATNDADANLAALCASTQPAAPAAPNICEHDGIDPHCVHDPDPCAVAPCMNGGACQTEPPGPTAATVPGHAGLVDACGCDDGWGWAGIDHRCELGKSTSRSEGVGCVQRRGDHQLLTFSCDCNGGYTGYTCEIAQVGLDECGCAAGQGWSRGNGQCADNGHTSVRDATTTRHDATSLPFVFATTVQLTDDERQHATCTG